MGIVELFIVAVGLSMDAFAASVCKGLCMRKVNWHHAAIVALFFGGFQAIMPVIGWLLGVSFAGVIEPVDHWIAFILLAFIGAKMLIEAAHEKPESIDCSTTVPKLDMKELLALAIATSIDALAVGVSFAFLGVNIALAAVVIGLTTFALSLIGVAIGSKFGSRFERTATIAGGIILILIGVKILLEHLGLLA